MKTITLPPSITTKTQGGLYTLPIGDDCPDEFVMQIILHGYHQKMVDVWTSCAKKKLPNGDLRPATNEERHAAADVVHDRLKSYTWNKRVSETEKLDYVEKALRELLTARFVGAGLGKTQAAKDARDSGTRMRVFRDVVIKPQLVPETADRLDEIASANYQRVLDAAHKTAQIMIEAQERADAAVEAAGGLILE